MQQFFIQEPINGLALVLFVGFTILAVAWLSYAAVSSDEDAPCFGWRYCLRKRQEAESEYRRFSGEVGQLFEKKTMLDQYTAEYYHTLQEAGFDSLSDTVDGLRVVQETLSTEMGYRRYSRVVLLIRYLGGELHGRYLEHAREKFVAWHALEGWKPHIDDILTRVSFALTKAGEETIRLGVRRMKSRRPTLSLAAELRDQLFKRL